MSDSKTKKSFWSRFWGSSEPEQESAPQESSSPEDLKLEPDHIEELPEQTTTELSTITAEVPLIIEPQPQRKALEEKTKPQPPKLSLWQKLKAKLSKTANIISDGLFSVFSSKGIDATTLEDLNDLLIEADMGLQTSDKLVASLKARQLDAKTPVEDIKRALSEDIEKILLPCEQPLELFTEQKPHVILVVGVNGAGKTTTIGKLAKQAKAHKKSVTLVAADTFRAAAIEQLSIWAQRSGVDFISKPQGSDPAAVAYEGMEHGAKTNADVVIIDTAGRLQNKTELMSELEKIVRVIKKANPEAPHKVLLLLDATTGQNAISQAEVFTKTVGVTGIIMSKLDGSARGGILVAIADKFQLPIHFIGIGESIDDLVPFNAKDFAKALVGLEN